MRETTADLLGIFAHDLAHPAINLTFQRAPAASFFPLDFIDRTEFGKAAIRQNHGQIADMVVDLAVHNRA